MQLQVVTPEGAKVSATVEGVNAPGELGALGILPGHRALLTSLRIGLLSYASEGETHWLSVNGGYMEVADDDVIVVTETAETPDQIDLERAEKALKEAQGEISAIVGDRPEALTIAQAALSRAETRIALTKHSKRQIPE